MNYFNNQIRQYEFDETSPIHKSQNSQIYKAYDKMFNRDVCLKIFSYSSINDLNRLKNEIVAQTRAGAVCANIPTLIDFFVREKDHTFCIVMQWITGKTLRNEIKTLDSMVFLNLMISLCDILHMIHRNGIQHKDIKPENILLTENGLLYLIDFNICIALPNLQDGTEYYRAPEMYISGIATSRAQADIFSIGVMMYEHFTQKIPKNGVHYGINPFENQTTWSYFTSPKAIIETLPSRIDEIITKCMSRAPDDRYRDTYQLKHELKNTFKESRQWKR